MSSSELLWTLSDYDHGAESHAEIRVNLAELSLRTDWKFDPGEDAKKRVGYSFFDVISFADTDALARFADGHLRGLMNACYALWDGPDEVSNDEEIDERLAKMRSQIASADTTSRKMARDVGKVSASDLVAAYGVAAPPALVRFIDEGRWREFEQRTLPRLPDYTEHFYQMPAPAVFAGRNLVEHASLFKKNGALPFAKLAGLSLGIEYWGVLQWEFERHRIQIATRTDVHDLADDLASFLHQLQP